MSPSRSSSVISQVSPDHTIIASPPIPSSKRDSLSNEEEQHSVATGDQADTTPSPGESTILTGRKLAVIFIALLLSVLLVSLDQTILSTALPKIASQFGAFTLQGWVATSFILAQTVFLPVYGQILRIFPTKWVLVWAVTIFETGSLISGVSQNVNQLIVGRTVSGMGAAGMYVSVNQILAEVSSLENRPKLFSTVGAVFVLSSVIGPLIGGAFTDDVSWRWCFFINMPIGGVSIVCITLLLKASPPLGSDPTKRSTREILRQVVHLDFVGATLIAGAVTSLVLALQWGGNTKSWGNIAVIISFVFAAVIAVAFLVWEKVLGEKAMVPLKIFKSRSIYAIAVFSFLSRFSMLVMSYYVPIFYQATRHHTATMSGIDLLPFMLGAVLSVIAIGQIIGQVGYYWPFLVAAPVFLAVGSGLLYSINTTTSEAKLIGYQILTGVGVGFGMQTAILAMQVEFQGQPSLISQATSMASFSQFLGGTVGLGVAEPVFASELSKYLLQYAPLAPAAVVKQSPTAIYTDIPANLIPGVVLAYTESLRLVFLLGVPVAGLGLIASLFIENIKIEKNTHAATAAKQTLENGREKV